MVPEHPPASPLVMLVPRGVNSQQVLAEGVLGVLPRDIDAPALSAALGAAAYGLVVVHPQVGARVLGRLRASGGHAGEPLSRRERQVLGLLAEGLPNKAIASSLNMSGHTVKFHVTAIMNKLGAASRTEAVVQATRTGLLDL